MNRKKWYAVYKGDKFLVQGTKEECALYLNVKPDSIPFYATPAYKKRVSQERGLIVIKVSD